MSEISSLIQTAFGDFAVYKDKAAERLFAGRSLPSFVKDYILNRFSNGEQRDDDQIRKYLAEKMPSDNSGLMRRLLAGEPVNITTRVMLNTDLADGKVTFYLPDHTVNTKMYVSSSVLEESMNEITEGENWGNITLQYMPPEGRRRGYVLMTSYKSFNPYVNVDFSDLIECRKGLGVDEWIDVILATMGYAPDSFPTPESKFMMISRLLPMLEANLNFIELGPKASGKSFIYSNMSRHIRMISGKATRAQLIYNHSTKQFGAIKYNDLVVFDEASALEFDDRTQELQNFLRGFLEAGSASLSNVKLASTCGIGLVGNIALTEELRPLSSGFVDILPDIFRTSAILDRFHMFIPGWMLPKISEGQLYYGWAIDNEVFSEFLHYLRTETYSSAFFDELVSYDNANVYVRHSKAVRRVASAYCKLLFPHVKSLDELTPEELEYFKELYRDYCLTPAVVARTYIYNELKAIDPEFKAESNAMPVFEMNISPDASVEGEIDDPGLEMDDPEFDVDDSELEIELPEAENGQLELDVDFPSLDDVEDEK